MELLGRRKTIAIVNLPVAACWVLIYFAQDKTILLVARTVLGVSFGGILILVYTSIAEYQPPKIRALSINLIGNVGSQVGTTLGHVLSILMNWRLVALVGVIPSGLSVILPYFWQETPSWLASKGRFAESEEAFNSLHVSSDASDNELRLLIACERKKRSETSTNSNKDVLGRKIVTAVKQTYFWRILLFGAVICAYRVASGRVLFITLAITMLQDITGSKDILFHTLVVDGMTILGSVISCYFLRRFKIRGLFFVSGVLADLILVLLGLCLYTFPDKDVYLSWTKVCLLGLYFVITLAGPGPVLETLLSEIFPLEIKSFFIILIGLIAGILQFLSIKLVPNMLAVMGYHGIFFFNASVILVCLSYMWFYLPETKGRSLHEIEYYFKNNTFNYSNEFSKPEQFNVLLNKRS